DIGGVATAAEKVIGASKRSFSGVWRRQKCGSRSRCRQSRRRRVKDEQRLVQIGNARKQFVFGEIVHEGTADAKLPACEGSFDLALGGDFVEALLEKAGHVGGIARRGDRYYGARLGNLGGRREHGRAAEAVADEDCGRAGTTAQFARGGDQI